MGAKRFEGFRFMASRSIPSFWRASAATAALALLAAPLVSADAKTTGKKEAAKPNLVASFGDWNVFVGDTAKGKICYVLAQPKTREPEDLKRDAGYAFISDRPSEGVHNEVSFIMGFEVAGAPAAAKPEKFADAAESDAKPEKAAAKSDKTSKTVKPKGKPADAKAKSMPTPVAAVGDQTFDLLPKGGNLWVKNAARESALIAEMKKGDSLEVKAASTKGAATSDTFSLTGFSQAMDRLDKECPRKG